MDDADDDAVAPLLSAGGGRGRGAGADGDGDGGRNGVREPKLYSPFACFAFTVNYIVGVGVLGVPKAFYEAGWALSLIILTLVTLVSYVSMVWLLEVMVRTEALTQLEEVHLEPMSGTVDINADGGGHDGDERTPALMDEKTSATAWWFRPTAFRALYTGMASPYDLDQRMEITTRKFEINQMVGMFLGVVPQRLYEASVLAYLFGTL